MLRDFGPLQMDTEGRKGFAHGKGTIQSLALISGLNMTLPGERMIEVFCPKSTLS